MFKIIAFYKFVALSKERVQEISTALEDYAVQNNIYGLVIIGKEGINSTSAGDENAIPKFQEFIKSIPEFSDIQFKQSVAEGVPFKRFKIKFRDEIVTLEKQEYFPNSKNNHLSPKEWNKVIKEESDYVLIDTRNDYEVELGKFKGAIDPKLKMFNEFPEYVKNSEIPKDKKVLMYCTGGIRCEKAIYEMQAQGYKNVFQLEGGILKYLEEFPNDQYQGECFVFDHRVAVDQNLKPSSTFHLCPHCGDPGNLISKCPQCGEDSKICVDCQDNPVHHCCSKNCAHHYLRTAQDQAVS